MLEVIIGREVEPAPGEAEGMPIFQPIVTLQLDATVVEDFGGEQAVIGAVLSGLSMQATMLGRRGVNVQRVPIVDEAPPQGLSPEELEEILAKSNEPEGDAHVP